jgi:hypothetical protein
MKRSATIDVRLTMVDSEASVIFVYDSSGRDFPSYSLERDARLTTACGGEAHKSALRRPLL